MSFTILAAEDAFWRPSNQMGVLNTDLAKQLSASMFGARLWRLTPGQASTRHRHRVQHELYVVLEGTGRIRIEHELLTLSPLSSVLVEPGCVRQIFNDTEHEALWLVIGTPPEAANTLEMTPNAARRAVPGRPQSPTTRTGVLAVRDESYVGSVQRIAVIGCGGAGKTTLARSLGNAARASRRAHRRPLLARCRRAAGGMHP